MSAEGVIVSVEIEGSAHGTEKKLSVSVPVSLLLCLSGE